MSRQLKRQSGNAETGHLRLCTRSRTAKNDGQNATDRENSGRIEKRTGYMTTDISWLAQKGDWSKIACIGAINTQLQQKPEHQASGTITYLAIRRRNCLNTHSWNGTYEPPDAIDVNSSYLHGDPEFRDHTENSACVSIERLNYTPALLDDVLSGVAYDHSFQGSVRLVLKVGDQVRMNDGYKVAESNKSRIWKVTADLFDVCGTMCVQLAGYRGCYAADGFTKIEDVEDPFKAETKLVRGHWIITEYEYLDCSICGEAYWTGCDSTQEAKKRLRDKYDVYN